MGDDSIGAGPRSPLKLRVFISSPADVEEERGIARAVLRRLEKEPPFEGRIELDEVSYDDPDAPASMDAHLTFQSAINQSKPKPSACDVVVVILWSRLGSEIPDPAYRKPDGRGHFTGTEWEFADGVHAAEQGSDTRVWVFRRRKAFSPPQPDDSKQRIKDKRRQEDKIRAFFKTSVKSYWWYAPPPKVVPDDFSAAHQDPQFDFLLGNHLRNLIWDRLQAAGKAQPANPDEGDERIENFLREYLGTPDQPTPFGGRQTDLDHLDAWLDNLTQPPRLLLAAPAGRGKSALLAHWVQGLIDRADLAVVFIPISVRFRTNLASVVFAALAARLSKLHGKPLYGASDIAGEGWRSRAAHLLGSRLPNDRRLLAILDGLDEAADWAPGADLFPYDLPAGTRVVVSARYLANMEDAAAWQHRLGWERPGRAQVMELPGLTREGVGEVLQSMGISGAANLAAELCRLSEGDPLLVKLYVDRLYTHREGAAGLRPEDLPGLPPGLTGFFDRWFDEQRALWGEQAPLKEPAVQAVLDVLACALGPLPRDGLLDHLTAPAVALTSWTLDEALRSLARLVIGDGRTQGYVFSHPRLGGYFNEKLSPNQRRAVIDRFLCWGADTLAALKEGSVTPSSVSPYLVEHYRAHLEGAGQAADSFLPLISDGWARAWFALEGGYAGFLTDLERVSDVVAQTNAEAARRGEPAPHLGAEIRCALCQASVSSLASRFPPELLAALVKHQVMDEGRALDYALQCPDEAMRAAALATLSPALHSDRARDRALEAASSFQDDQYRTRALSALAPTLSPSQRAIVLGTATQIANAFWRGRLLEALVPHLTGDQLDRAREIAEAMSPSRGINFPKEDALAAVVERYAAVRRVDSALEILDDLEPPHCWIKAAAGAIGFLPEDRRMTVLQMALTKVRFIGDRFYRAEAYLALAPCVGLLGAHEGVTFLREARCAARALGRDRMTVRWLTALVPSLPVRFQIRTLDYATKVLDGVDDDYYSDPLAPRLALSKHYARLGAVDRALEVVATRMHPVSALLGQATVIGHLPEADRARVVAMCEKQAEALDTYPRLRVIGLLADHLPPTRRHAVLTDAWTNVLRIGDGEACRNAIFLVAPVLAELGDLTNAHATVQSTVGPPDLQAEALTRIGVAAPTEDERRSVLKEALRTACSIHAEEVWNSDRDRRLVTIAPQLAAAGCIDEALDAIRRIADWSYTLEAWATTVPYLAQHDVTRAWRAYRELHSGSMDLLVPLLPYLTGAELDAAVREARNLCDGDPAQLAAVTRLAALGRLDDALAEANVIEHPRVRVDALLEAVRRLPADDPRRAAALAQARKAAEQLDSGPAQAKAFIHIAEHLAESERGDLLRRAEERAREAISQGGHGPSAVMSFVDKLPDRDALIAEALGVVFEENPSWLSTDLIQHLPYPLLDAADGAVIEAVDNDYQRDELRARIAVRLAQLGFGAQALARIRTFTRREFIAEALAAIGRYLDSGLLASAVAMLPERFDEQDSVASAEALAGLADHLSGPALEQAIDVACAMSSKAPRATALAALAARLRSLSVEALYPLWWQRMLPRLATRSREELVSDLTALAPALGRLGGADALKQLCQGIDDVTRWWP